MLCSPLQNSFAGKLSSDMSTVVLQLKSIGGCLALPPQSCASPFLSQLCLNIFYHGQLQYQR